MTDFLLSMNVDTDVVNDDLSKSAVPPLSLVKISEKVFTELHRIYCVINFYAMMGLEELPHIMPPLSLGYHGLVS
jgi:hypothetical protein